MTAARDRAIALSAFAMVVAVAVAGGRCHRLGDELAGSAVARLAVVHVERANVRARPGTDQRVVGQLRRMEAVMVLDELEDWSLVRGEERPITGWVYSPLLYRGE